jgi:hypothetical protein
MNSAQMYRDPETGRTRWAVLHGPSGVWYFPKRYGRAAAEKLARERNAQDRAYAGLDPKFNAALAAVRVRS